jgi:hypothetical protein
LRGAAMCERLGHVLEQTGRRSADVSEQAGHVRMPSCPSMSQ